MEYENQFKSIAWFDEWKEKYDARRKTQSKFVKARLSWNVELQSNGESAMRYFAEFITENALYLLDEPENSMAIALRKELGMYIADSAGHFCRQFVIAAHFPVLLAVDDIGIYDFDTVPVTCKKRT